MLIALVLILLLIWAAVVWSIYSNFLVFYTNFNESQNYHKAYYNSIMALERAELVIKQRAPWYVWNWWWKIWAEKWESTIDGIADWWSDGIIQKFSYLSNKSNTNNTSTVFWDINSRATRIPAEKWGDVEAMLAYSNLEDPDDPENSNNYNMMDYEDSQIFLLYYDPSEWNPYTKTKCPSWCQESESASITWFIRLPKDFKESFWNLNTNTSLVSNWAKDDAIVDRQIRWKYKDNEDEQHPFTIYAAQSSFEDEVYYESDSAIRESNINYTPNSGTPPGLSFNFWNNSKRAPIPDEWSSKWRNANLMIISPKESEIVTYLWKNSKDLSKVLNNEDSTSKKFSERVIRLSLLNLLKSEKNMIYPFLEYYIDFWTTVSDKYFTINAEWNYGDYKINKILWRPANKESILWSFTSIF